MAEDLDRTGTLRESTAALMWTANAAHASATVVALARPPALGLPAEVAHTVGPDYRAYQHSTARWWGHL